MLGYKHNTTDQRSIGHLTRQSNDIVIAFVKNIITKNSIGKAFTFAMHKGLTGTLIEPRAALSHQTPAHEVGHILGASHGTYHLIHRINLKAILCRLPETIKSCHVLWKRIQN